MKPESDWSHEKQEFLETKITMSAAVTTPGTPAVSSTPGQPPVNSTSTTLQPLTNNFNPNPNPTQTPTSSAPSQDLTAALAAASYSNPPYQVYPNNVAAAFDPAQVYCWSQAQNPGYPNLGTSVMGSYPNAGLEDQTYGLTTATNGIAELGKLQPYENLEPTAQAYAQHWPYSSYLNPDEKLMDPAAQYNFAAGIDKNFYGHSFTVS